MRVTGPGLYAEIGEQGVDVHLPVDDGRSLFHTRDNRAGASGKFLCRWAMIAALRTGPNSLRMLRMKERTSP